MVKKKINLGRKVNLGSLFSAPARAYYGAKGRVADKKRESIIKKRTPSAPKQRFGLKKGAAKSKYFAKK